MNWKKYILAVLSFCGAIVFAQAQTYTVIHGSSNCKRLPSSAVLKLGDVISATEKVDLGNASGQMVLWEKAEGLVVLNAKKQASGKSQTIGSITELKHALPSRVDYQEQFATMEGLQKHFEGRRYLILGKTWLLAAPGFNLEGDTLLFYKFESPKANLQVNRKVEHHGDSLLLTPKLILDMNGRPIPPDDARGFELYWLDLKTKGYKKLAAFEFVFVDEASIAREIKLLLSEIAKTDMDPSNRIGLVRQFLSAAYGDPDLHNLMQFLQAQGLQ
ncbi:MAG: hypothetical protein IPP17_03890 [Bacteroidetes bacterium]|nr:hypothetical protein [Bacteroidota bacterium]